MGYVQFFGLPGWFDVLADLAVVFGSFFGGMLVFVMMVRLLVIVKSLTYCYQWCPTNGLTLGACRLLSNFVKLIWCLGVHVHAACAGSVPNIPFFFIP